MTREHKPAQHKLYQISVPKGATPEERAVNFRKMLADFVKPGQETRRAANMPQPDNGLFRLPALQGDTPRERATNCRTMLRDFVRDHQNRNHPLEGGP